MKRSFVLFYFVALLVTEMTAFGANLSGSVFVRETSQTATSAKNNAINLARRQILDKVLANYAESDALHELLKDTTDDELVNLISSSSVLNEKISSDTYSARITMNIDNEAVKKWLVAHDVPNWIPNTETAETFSLFIVVPNGLADWAELKRIARANGTNIETQTINGNQIFAKMPSNQRAKFTAAINQMGWRYADNDGVLKIWK